MPSPTPPQEEPHRGLTGGAATGRADLRTEFRRQAEAHDERDEQQPQATSEPASGRLFPLGAATILRNGKRSLLAVRLAKGAGRA